MFVSLYDLTHCLLMESDLKTEPSHSPEKVLHFSLNLFKYFRHDVLDTLSYKCIRYTLQQVASKIVRNDF